MTNVIQMHIHKRNEVTLERMSAYRANKQRAIEIATNISTQTSDESALAILNSTKALYSAAFMSTVYFMLEKIQA